MTKRKILVIPSIDAGDFSYLSARATSVQSIATGSISGLTFHVADKKINISFNPPNSFGTILQSGLYIITGACSFAANVTGRRGVAININGSQRYWSVMTPAVVAFQSLNLSVVSPTISLVNGDTFGLAVLQDSGVSLNTIISAPYTPILTVIRVGDIQ